MVNERNFHIQRQYTSEYQMLEKQQGETITFMPSVHFAASDWPQLDIGNWPKAVFRNWCVITHQGNWKKELEWLWWWHFSDSSAAVKELFNILGVAPVIWRMQGACSPPVGLSTAQNGSIANPEVSCNWRQSLSEQWGGLLRGCEPPVPSRSTFFNCYAAAHAGPEEAGSSHRRRSSCFDPHAAGEKGARKRRWGRGKLQPT